MRMTPAVSSFQLVWVVGMVAGGESMVVSVELPLLFLVPLELVEAEVPAPEAAVLAVLFGLVLVLHELVL